MQFNRLTMSVGVFVLYFTSGQFANAQQGPVVGRVQIEKSQAGKQEKASAPARDNSEVVVWLMPVDRSKSADSGGTAAQRKSQLIQKNKSFQPHLLVVRVGSAVDFPNRDPFFHNVFSLFDGKRFDLGLYEAGATNSVRFDHPGISFLFCNIHPEMSAVVVAVDTPYYGVSDKAGSVLLGDVPDGKYELHLWYERSLPEDLKGMTRMLDIGSNSRDLGTIKVRQNPEFSTGHKNKYGQDYAPPPTQSYPHP